MGPLGSPVRVLCGNYVQWYTLCGVEIHLPHTRRVDPLENQCLFYAGCYLPLGPTRWFDCVAAKQRPDKVIAILVCNACLLLGTHVFACRGLLRFEGC